ncbi:MAG TPA: branched-chain amino acid ABC transporter substrate-binding protein [Aeromicrobium sp.]|nr:branched-chain amino acid ABC transporter substrate-binding protein [Aeromicrobium sp.]
MLGSNGRLSRTIVLFAAAGLALAGCGDSKKSVDTGGDATSTTAAAGTTTTAAEVVGAGGQCKGQTVALAFFGALTGDSANLGINERNGAKLAVQEFNKANADCQVQLQQFDSAGDPAQAPALAQKVVQNKDVVGVIGPAFSGESKVADPIFNEAVVPTITASATNPSLSTNGWKVFHRAVANDDFQGPAVAKYILNDVKAKKVAVIDDASEYGKGIGDVVRAKIKAGGGTVVVSEAIDPKATDFSSTVNKIKPSGATAVFFGGYYQAAGVLAKQLKDGGVTAAFVAPDGSRDEGFVTAAGAAAEGAILTAPAAPAETVPGGTKFVTDYKAAIGSDPGLYSVEAYDAANAFLAAIKAGNLTREKINTYLGSTLNYKGLSKTLAFDAKGEPKGQAIIWAYQVKGGKIVGLAPIKV